MSRPNPAAVVLAAGLGTRMRSATPKHFHPLLGRRMVDWVVEAARAVDADPLVVVTSPGGAGAFDGVEVAVQAEPRGTGDALAAARDGARRGRGRPVRPQRRRACAQPGAPARPPRGAPPRERSRHDPLLPADRPTRVRPHHPRRRGRRSGDRRGRRRDAGATCRGRGQLGDLRLRRRPALARARPDRHGEHAGRAVPDRRRTPSR